MLDALLLELDDVDELREELLDLLLLLPLPADLVACIRWPELDRGVLAW